MAEPPAGQGNAPMDSPKVRIMLVEDESIIALDVGQRLEILGHRVVVHAASGPEAIRLASESTPDLILMDVRLRGPMDGVEAAAAIRTAQDIPIVYLTAYADETTLKRARLTEPYGYLLKPFDDRELQSAIEIALYKHGMEQKLRCSEERYRLATLAANDGIWDWDLKTNEVFYSSRWCEMLGLGMENRRGAPEIWLNRLPAGDRARLDEAMQVHLRGGTPSFECEYRIRHDDGGLRWVLCRGRALFDAHGAPYRMAGSQSDISSRKRLEEELVHKAMHDELTGLPNRALFVDRLGTALEEIRGRRMGGLAVMFLDIDHFKVINDSMGHAMGDALLVAFARRLERRLRPGDTISRFGGDEFVILVNGVDSLEEVQRIVERISGSLRKPFLLEERELFVAASIGIVFTDDGVPSADDLLRDADIAMYHSKNNGRSHAEVFHPDMRALTWNRMQQEGELRQALKNHEFILYYQPIFSLTGMQVTGFEALIRWQHPARGLLAPSEFMEVAEQSGLIVPMGEWVLRSACAQLRAWNEALKTTLKVAINLSPSQLTSPDLIRCVQAVLEETGLAPACLELELTETAALQDLERTSALLQTLREMGVQIAVDDFGKGYSSMDYIKHLPGTALKIDRSFVEDLTESGSESAIVLAMVTMAHQLNLSVTAEGIETVEQLRVLSGMNCDQLQGFYLGGPASVEEIGRLLQDGWTNEAKPLLEPNSAGG